MVAVEGRTRLAEDGAHRAQLERFDAALLTGPDAAAADLWTDGTAAVIALSAAGPDPL